MYKKILKIQEYINVHAAIDNLYGLYANYKLIRQLLRIFNHKLNTDQKIPQNGTDDSARPWNGRIAHTRNAQSFPHIEILLKFSGTVYLNR